MIDWKKMNILILVLAVIALVITAFASSALSKSIKSDRMEGLGDKRQKVRVISETNEKLSFNGYEELHVVIA